MNSSFPETPAIAQTRNKFSRNLAFLTYSVKFTVEMTEEKQE